MDAPTYQAHRAVISTMSNECPTGAGQMAISTGLPVSTAWPSANMAIFVPFEIWTPFWFRCMWWANGATVGNGQVDAGIYTLGGARLFAASTVANTTTSGTSVIQSVTNFTPILLTPDVYYMALALQSASDTVFAKGMAQVRYVQMLGMAQQAAARPLPNPATLATSATSNIYPLFGISSRLLI